MCTGTVDNILGYSLVAISEIIAAERWPSCMVQVAARFLHFLPWRRSHPFRHFRHYLAFLRFRLCLAFRHLVGARNGRGLFQLDPCSCPAVQTHKK
jgi:hypothetical protein